MAKVSVNAIWRVWCRLPRRFQIETDGLCRPDGSLRILRQIEKKLVPESGYGLFAFPGQLQTHPGLGTGAAQKGQDQWDYCEFAHV